MEKKEEKKPTYIDKLITYYFAPEMRSIFTVFFLIIFSYIAFYYIDNLFLAFKFLLYILFGTTALQGTAFLFTGLLFIIALVFPFSTSIYAILVLERIWAKPIWTNTIKWLLTIALIFGSSLIIVISDDLARFAGKTESMRSFIEDAGLVNKL